MCLHNLPTYKNGDYSVISLNPEIVFIINLTQTSMPTKEISRNNSEILQIFFISQTIMNLPFVIASLCMTFYAYPDICLLNTFVNTNKIFFLGTWVETDGYIRLAVLVAVFFIFILEKESSCQSAGMVAFCGNLIRFYFLFDIGWTITGSILFWGNFLGQDVPTYQICSSSYTAYLFILLIYSYIIIPINLYIGGFRSNVKQETSTDVPLSTVRANTELIGKTTI